MKISRLLLVAMIALVTAACSTPGAQNFTSSRVNCALLGGAGGGAIGAFDDSDSALIGAAVGAAVGALLCGGKDEDGDGVLDKNDQCPGTPPGEPVDAVGCEFDDDGDGVVNSKDQCPDTPAGMPVDRNGCPLDDDRDGVPNSLDQCPGTPAGATVDENGCADTDGDGVFDYRDQCPNTAPGVAVDNTGCDLEAEYRLQGVTFEFDSARLTSAAEARLDEDVQILLRHSDLSVEIAGHTDSVGAEVYNQELSQRRAQSVKDYLVSKGADPSKLTVRGYGESDPIATNDTDAGRAQNRRVEFRQQ
ncbi:MAG: OmpA family protein [Pseudomonadota bacterium]